MDIMFNMLPSSSIHISTLASLLLLLLLCSTHVRMVESRTTFQRSSRQNSQLQDNSLVGAAQVRSADDVTGVTLVPSSPSSVAKPRSKKDKRASSHLSTFKAIESHIQRAQSSSKYVITFAPLKLPSHGKTAATVESATLRVYARAVDASLLPLFSPTTVSIYAITGDDVKRRHPRHRSLVGQVTVHLDRARWNMFDVTSGLAGERFNATLTFELEATDAGVSSFHTVDDSQLPSNLQPRLEVRTRQQQQQRRSSAVDTITSSHNANDVSKTAERSTCALHTTWVTFEQLGYRGALGVDGQPGFDFAFCRGSCEAAGSPSHGAVRTNYAKYRQLLHVTDPRRAEEAMPGLCCTATKFAPVTMMRFEPASGSFVTTQLADMIATECSCQ